MFMVNFFYIKFCAEFEAYTAQAEVHFWPTVNCEKQGLPDYTVAFKKRK